jgi:hypothetical protein
MIKERFVIGYRDGDKKYFEEFNTNKEEAMQRAKTLKKKYPSTALSRWTYDILDKGYVLQEVLEVK